MGKNNFITSIVSQKLKPYVPPAPPEPVGPEMIMTWNTNTTSAGSSTSTQINLPLRGEVYWSDPNPPGFDFVAIPASDYDFWVDWGDGNGWSDHITGNTDSNKLHTYASAGIKTVKVKGQFGSFYFANTGDRNKLTNISQFDSMIFDCGYKAFSGCENLNFTATDAPVLALTKSTILDDMFRGALTFNTDIGAWNVSAATRMNGMFGTNGGFGTPAIFNQDISGWDMSNVVDIGSMFSNNNGFNQDIGAWDVSSVEWMRSTFYYSSVGFNSFNNGGSPSISGWTTSAVTDMTNMFGDSSFNQPIGAWDVSNVTSMSGMFSYNNIFNQDISGWNTGKVTTMLNMFNYNYAFNQNIGGWDVSKVTNMSGMFNANTAFANGGSPSISGWTTSGVTDMSSMFNGTPFNEDIGAWDVSNVVNMYRMFSATNLFNNGGSSSINNWDTSKVTNMSWMFYVSTQFNQPVGGWDVSKVTDFDRMFMNANTFNNGGSPDISGWTLNTIQNVDMNYMFQGADNFDTDIGAWNTEKVVNMSYMFNGAKFNNGGSPSISGWTTSAVTNMSQMFYSNRYFAQYIGSWDVSNVTTMYRMFARNPANQPFVFDYTLYDWQPLSLTAGASSGLADFMYPASPITYNYMSTPLYNQLLINWSGLGGLPSNITANFGGSRYSGSTATTARGVLTSTKGWTITDGGLLP